MNTNIIDSDVERDVCEYRRGSTLAVLKEVQRAYEERLTRIEELGAGSKTQMQIELLKSWVNDLLGQNTLLVQAVEDLETEATSKLLYERRKHSEIVSELQCERAALRRRLSRSQSDARGLVEVLRRLRELDHCTLDGIHFFEVTESDIFGTVDWQENPQDQGDQSNEQRKQRRIKGKHYRLL